MYSKSSVMIAKDQVLWTTNKYDHINFSVFLIFLNRAAEAIHITQKPP